MLTDINSKLFVRLTDGTPTVVISISASFFFQKNFQEFVLFKWPDKYSNHCWMFATFHINSSFFLHTFIGNRTTFLRDLN